MFVSVAWRGDSSAVLQAGLLLLFGGCVEFDVVHLGVYYGDST